MPDKVSLQLRRGFAVIWLITASLVIGVTAFTVSVAGFRLGNKLRSSTGSWGGVIGGPLLIGIGIRILVTHVA